MEGPFKKKMRINFVAELLIPAICRGEDFSGGVKVRLGATSHASPLTQCRQVTSLPVATVYSAVPKYSEKYGGIMDIVI